MMFRVTINIDYDETDMVTPEQVKAVLFDAIDHLADNGLLSGELDIDIDDWNVSVTQLT